MLTSQKSHIFFVLQQAIYTTMCFDPLKPSGYFMYNQVLTFINSTFCPHSVFMCFERISEQTAIIPYTLNQKEVFIIQMGSVYCAVRNAYLYKIQIVVFEELKDKSSKSQWPFLVPRDLTFLQPTGHVMHQQV